MLKMKCPKCNEMITSALLSDMEQIPCPHCKELVLVDNVMVFSEGFTFHRNDLIKRMFRYKTLLAEIRKERELLDMNPDASEDGKRSLERFAHALVEVMAGARNNLRIDFSDPVSVRYLVGGKIQTGKLVNLSMSGACVSIDDDSIVPKKKAPLTIDFKLPASEHLFSLSGTVSWARKGPSIGIEFDQLPQEASKVMWEFITSAVES